MTYNVFGGTLNLAQQLHMYTYSTRSVGKRRGSDSHTDRHTDGRVQYTFLVSYPSHEMQQNADGFKS